LSKKPSLVFLHAGANDFYYDVDKKEARKNISSMINKLLRKGAMVVYWTTAPSSRDDRNEAYEAYRKIEMKIASKFTDNPNFIFVDMFNLFPKDSISKSYTLIEPDGNEILGLKAGDLDYVHFNQYGNAVIAKILLKEAFDINFDENKFLQSLSDNSNKYLKY
jgi:lysophospholipase L1-like esterase